MTRSAIYLIVFAHPFKWRSYARAICNAEASLALRAAKGEDEREVHLQSDGFRCAMASSIERVLRRGLGLAAEKNK